MLETEAAPIIEKNYGGTSRPMFLTAVGRFGRSLFFHSPCVALRRRRSHPSRLAGFDRENHSSGQARALFGHRQFYRQRYWRLVNPDAPFLLVDFRLPYRCNPGFLRCGPLYAGVVGLFIDLLPERGYERRAVYLRKRAGPRVQRGGGPGGLPFRSKRPSSLIKRAPRRLCIISVL
jgi:hypothetical protein